MAEASGEGGGARFQKSLRRISGRSKDYRARLKYCGVTPQGQVLQKTGRGLEENDTSA
jgi:hypothetical protein